MVSFPFIKDYSSFTAQNNGRRREEWKEGDQLGISFIIQIHPNYLQVETYVLLYVETWKREWII